MASISGISVSLQNNGDIHLSASSWGSARWYFTINSYSLIDNNGSSYPYPRYLWLNNTSFGTAVIQLSSTDNISSRDLSRVNSIQIYRYVNSNGTYLRVTTYNLPSPFYPVATPVITSVTQSSTPDVTTVNGSNFLNVSGATINNGSYGVSSVTFSSFNVSISLNQIRTIYANTTTNGSSNTYTAVQSPTISGISNNTNITNGITISGSSFTGATGVTVNGASYSYTIASDTQITVASLPPSTRISSAAVTNAGGTATYNIPTASQFYPVRTPTISGISNNTSITNGITINGSNFSGTTGVTVNNVSYSYTFVSDTQITVGSLPVSTKISSAIVTNAVGTSATFTLTAAGSQFYPVGIPNITSVSSYTGSQAPAGTMLLNGSNFLNVTSVTINNNLTGFTATSSTPYTGTLTNTSFNVNFAFSDCYNIYITDSLGNNTSFNVKAAPSITSVSIDTTLTNGVIITGNNLSAASSISTNGGALQISSKTSTQVKATNAIAPLYKITSFSLTFGGISINYTPPTPFYPVGTPSITSAASSTINSGATTITGTNLYNASSLTINSITYYPINGSITNTSLDVALLYDNVSSASITDIFGNTSTTFNVFPSISSVSLYTSITLGISINGSHFIGATGVKINGQNYSSLTYTVFSEIKITVGLASNIKVTSVAVTTPGGTSTYEIPSALQFYPVGIPNITLVAQSSTSGNIRITGTGLYNVNNVVINNQLYQPISGTITNTTIDVQISYSSITSIYVVDCFNNNSNVYATSANITRVSLDPYISNGIIITGSGFNSTPSSVTANSGVSTCTNISINGSTVIYATLPSAITVNSISVTINGNVVNYTLPTSITPITATTTIRIISVTQSTTSTSRLIIRGFNFPLTGFIQIDNTVYNYSSAIVLFGTATSTMIELNIAFLANMIIKFVVPTYYYDEWLGFSYMTGYALKSEIYNTSNPPTITGVVVDSAATNGIVITGTNFSNVASVTVNNQPCTFSSTTTTINATLPSLFKITTITVISIGGSVTYPINNAFYPIPTPSITSLQAIGSTQSTKVNGSNLYNAASVKVNGILSSAAITLLTNESFVASVYTADINNILVTDIFNNNSNTFTLPSPTISSVSKNTTIASAIDISGSNLSTIERINVTMKGYDSIAVSSLTYNTPFNTRTSNLITFVASSDKAISSIQVIDNNSKSSTLNINPIIYPVITPTITNVVTTSGVDLSIDISGTYLGNVSYVYVNTNLINNNSSTLINVISDNLLRVALPTPYYITSVKVYTLNCPTTNPVTYTLTNGFYPTGLPAINSVTSTSDDYVISISGLSFTFTTSVTVNGTNYYLTSNASAQPYNTVTVVSNTALTVRLLTAFIINTVNVTVNNSRSSETYSLPSLVYPKGGPVLHNYSLTQNAINSIDVSGINFTNVISMSVTDGSGNNVTYLKSTGAVSIINDNLARIVISQPVLVASILVSDNNTTARTSSYSKRLLLYKITGASPTTNKFFSINIFGENFTTDISAVILNRSPQNLSYPISINNIIDNTTLTVTVDPYFLIFSISIIDVSGNSGKQYDVTTPFYPLAPLSISTVSPNPSNFIIDISGAYLLDVFMVTFNYASSNPVSINSFLTERTNSSLSMSVPEPLFNINTVKITNNSNQTSVKDNLNIYPRAPLTISTYYANETNNFQIDISGTNLLDASSVIFNSNIQSTGVTVKSNNLVTAGVPSTLFPVTSVQITNVNSQTSNTASLTVFPRIEPTISSVYVDSSANYQIDISGNYFLDVSAVLFNYDTSGVVGSIISQTNNLIYASTASATAPLFKITSVQLTNRYNQISQFPSQTQPTPLNIYPRAPLTISTYYANPTNNFQIDISGTNLLDASSVIFNSNIQSTGVTVKSNNLVTAGVPSTLFPVTSVQITNVNSQTSNTASLTVFPRIEPTISSVYVDSSANYQIDISGNYFLDVSAVLFNYDTSGVVGSIISQTNNLIYASTASATAPLFKITSVQLTNRYNQISQFPSQTQPTPLNIYPRAPITITSVYANASNDYQIDVSGTNLLDVSSVILNYDISGGVIGVINRSANSLITITSPNLFQITSIKITNSNNINFQYSIPNPFFPRALPTINSVYADVSNNAISIEGTNFLGVSQIIVSDNNTSVNIGSIDILYKSNNLLRVLIKSQMLIKNVTVINTNAQQVTSSSFTPFYPKTAPIIDSVKTSNNDYQIDISGTNLLDSTSIIFNYNTTPIIGTILSGKTANSISVTAPYLFQITSMQITNSNGFIGNYSIPSGLTPFFPRAQPTIDDNVGVFPDFSYNLAIDISGTNLLAITRVAINTAELSFFQGVLTVINNNKLRLTFNTSFEISQLSIANSYTQTTRYIFPSPGFLYPSSLPTISSPSSTAIDLQVSISGTNLLNVTSVVFNYDATPVTGTIITQTSTEVKASVTTLFKITSIKVTDTNEKVGTMQSLNFFPRAIPDISGVIVDPSNNLRVSILGNNLLNVSIVSFNSIANNATIRSQTNTTISIEVTTLFKINTVSISNSYLQTRDYTIPGGLYPRATPTITSLLSANDASGAALPDLQVNISGTNLIDISSVIFNYDTNSSVNGNRIISQTLSSVIASMSSLIRITSIQVTNSNGIMAQTSLILPFFPRAAPNISSYIVDPNNDLRIIIYGSNFSSVTDVWRTASNGLNKLTQAIIQNQTNIMLTILFESLLQINEISIYNDYSQRATYVFTGGLYPRAQPRISNLGVLADSISNFTINISGTNLLNTTSVIFNYDDPGAITILPANMPTLTNTLLSVNISQYPLFQINKVKIVNSYSQYDTYNGLTLFPRSTPSIDPNGVSADSTTNLQLNIAGNNLLDASAVIFNYSPTTSVAGTILTGQTNNLLKVNVPDTLFPATSVQVTNIYGQIGTLSNFTVYPRIEPAISSVYVDSSANYQIDISGNYLLDASSALFNYDTSGVVGTIQNKTNNSLFVTTQTLFKITSIKITNIYSQIAIKQNLNLYPRAVMSIASVIANSSNNFQFDISGTNLLDASSVIFNSNIQSTSFTVQNNNLVTATVPDTVFPATSVQIVNVNGQTATMSNLAVYPKIEPTITSVNAHSSADYQIVIEGNYFLGISAVTFNSGVTGTIIISSTTNSLLTVSIPQQLIQITSVQLTNSNNQITTRGSLNVYPRATMSITSVIANSSNNFQFDISGANLLDVTSVIFNSNIQSTSFTVQNNNLVNATVPDTLLQVTSVKIANVNGQMAILSNLAVYTRIAPTITSVNAHSSADYQIVIEGNYFLSVSTVTFNSGVTGTIITNLKTNNSLTVSIPQQLIQITSVQLTNSNNQITLRGSLNVYPRATMSISSFYANSSNDLQIDISGTNLLDVSSVIFNYDRLNQATGTILTGQTNNLVKVSVPTTLFPATNVKITNVNGQIAAADYIIYPRIAPEISLVSADATVDYQIVIQGNYFLNVSTVIFNSGVTGTIIISSTTNTYLVVSIPQQLIQITSVQLTNSNNQITTRGSWNVYPRATMSITSVIANSSNDLQIDISGTNLLDVSSVIFNTNIQSTSFTVQNNNLVKATVPDTVFPATIVQITNVNGQTTSFTGLTVYPRITPLISSVYADSSTNYQIIIEGNYLSDVSSVTFNSNSITGTIITSKITKNLLTVSIPQQLIQLTSIKITNMYGQFADKSLSLYPNSPKTFTSVYADTSNNFQIDISGTNFLDVSSVIFNSTIQSTSFTVQSNGFLTAVVPPTVYPATSVRLINFNGLSYDAPGTFAVYPKVVPVINTIGADSSSDFLIVINGYFLSTINSVIFNSGTSSLTGTILSGQTGEQLQISINSITRITSVIIKNTYNQTASLSSNLTPFYPRAQPAIINVAFAANQTSSSSTYLINISGLNFINTSTVLFNGSVTPASFVVNSSVSITVTINSLFFINSITVRNSYNQTATTTNTTNLIYPVGTATMPASPMTSSQPNSLTITGTNFLNTKAIFFNDPIPADSFIINSNTSITVFLSGLFEIYDVAIVDVYGVTNIYPISPTFFPNIPPTVSSVTVSSNNVATINGNNLSNIVSVKVNGDNLITSYTITDNNTITVNIPHNVLISLITVTDGYNQSVSITPSAPFYPVGDPTITDFYYINEINANIIGTNLLNIKNVFYNDSFAPLSFTINSETKITTTVAITGNIPIIIKSVTVIDCFGKRSKFTTVADNSLDNKTFTNLGTKNNNLSYTSVSMIPGNRLGNNISINSKVVKNSNPDVIPASTQVDQAVNAIKYGRGGKTIFGNIGTNTNGDTRLGQIQGQTLSPFLSRNKF